MRLPIERARDRRPSPRALSRLGVALLILTLGAGCEPAARRPALDRETPAAGAPVWPPAPQRPRVRFVQAVAGPADLGIRPAWWERVGDFLAGRDEAGFVRPTGVAATEAALYVADPGARTLWILDHGAGRARRIRDAGGQALASPVAVALGGGGRLYLADSSLARVFVLDAAGGLVGTIADARLRRPAGVAYDPGRDRLYVADSAVHQVLVFDGAGQPAGEIGRRGAGEGELNFPTHVTVARDGTVYVTDALGFRIQWFAPDGTFAGRLGRHGDGPGDFASPKGVALDSEGHLYVVEALFDAVQVFDGHGRFLLTVGEQGLGPGQFWLPGGLFIDGRDRIYVADAYNRRVQVLQYLAGAGDE